MATAKLNPGRRRGVVVGKFNGRLTRLTEDRVDDVGYANGFDRKGD